ncbi:SNAP25 ous protein snap33 [Ancistrocladus abbreviatus]
MLGLKKSPLHRFAKHSPIDSTTPNNISSNPFDSDDELDNKQTLTSSKRSSSEPALNIPNSITNPFDDDYGEKGTTSSASKYKFSYAERSKYKNDFRDTGGLENQSVQELENYAVYKSEETTKTVDDCLKIATEMRDDATKTLITLHQQGEQITRTHEAAADIDLDLSRGEKLLGNLGGIFSKTWKPKKTRPITGPVITRDDPVARRGGHLEQREKLGLAPLPNGRPKSRTPPPEPTDALQKVEVEKAKQDDALSDLSDLLGELKGMAVDMGSEIERQNKALDHLYDDVDEINFRVKNANQRGRRLLRK